MATFLQHNKALLTRLVFTLVVLAVLVALVGSAKASDLAQQTQDTISSEEASVENPSSTSGYAPTVKSLQSMPAAKKTVEGFSLSSDDAPALTQNQKESLDAAINALEARGAKVSLGIVNLSTGKGYTYNADQKIYGASTFKGPFTVFVCQNYIEPGKRSLSFIKSLGTSTIRHSSNEAYSSMRSMFGGYRNAPLANWLENLGIRRDIAMETSFPTYSARESLMLWMNTYLYLNGNSSSAACWLKDNFSHTNVSPIRKGIEEIHVNPLDILKKLSSVLPDTKVSLMEGEETAPALQACSRGIVSFEEVATAASKIHSANKLVDQGIFDITVYNKAGWIDGARVNSMSDAGIVVEGDEVYLVSIMTSAPDSAKSRAQVAKVAEALWEARGVLL